uniref:Uncharacterized protein n=1 Tax=Mycobacterium riyadhense TaxID=486698 RepID=A0A653ETJ0_9MYCO|nr:hypothetical protein BIN_B_03736 [Mycobacterium riyadhense]
MDMKKIVGRITLAGAVCATALGIGAGVAQADPGPRIPGPPGPHIDDPIRWQPVPPGQIQQWCPWQAPPGHWIGGPHGIPCT